VDTAWLDPDEQEVWRRFLQMHAALMARLARELQRQSGLSGADYEVLVHLSEAPGRRLRVFALADATGWEKSRLSHHLSRMVGRGLVRREGCPTDSRGAFIVLTETGWSTIAAAAPPHVEQVRRLFVDPLTVEQRSALGLIARAVLEAVSADAPASARPDGRAGSDGPDRAACECRPDGSSGSGAAGGPAGPGTGAADSDGAAGSAVPGE